MFQLSYSSMDLFCRDKKAWIRKYVHGEEQFVTPQMKFGKRFAEAMEHREEEHGDDIEMIKPLIPDYKERELKVYKVFEGKEFVGILDGWSPKKIGEYKTGKLWNQNMVDQSEQITFYAWLLDCPEYQPSEEMELTWVETKTEDGFVSFTGRVETFQTKRSRAQIDLMGRRAVRMYDEMLSVWETEATKNI